MLQTTRQLSSKWWFLTKLLPSHYATIFNSGLQGHQYPPAEQEERAWRYARKFSWARPNRNKMHPFHCCCCSVAKSCPTLHDPMNCSTPGFPVLHHFPAFAQTHVHWVSDTIYPSHPLSPLSSVFPNFRVFSNELALHISWPKYWSFSISPSMNIQGLFPLVLTGLISLLSKRLSRVFSSPTVQKHQFFSAQPSLWSNSHIHTWPFHWSQLNLMVASHYWENGETWSRCVCHSHNF